MGTALTHVAFHPELESVGGESGDTVETGERHDERVPRCSPVPVQGLWVFDEGQRSAISGQLSAGHAEARRAGERLPGVLPRGPFWSQDWPIADGGRLALPGPVQVLRCGPAPPVRPGPAEGTITDDTQMTMWLAESIVASTRPKQR